MSIGLLYLFVKLDVIVGTFIILSALLLVVGVFTVAITVAEYSDMGYEDQYRKLMGIVFKILLPIFIISSLFAILLPTTKEVAFIYIASKVTNSDKAKNMADKALQIPDKALDILDNKMNEYIKEQTGGSKNDK